MPVRRPPLAALALIVLSLVACRHDSGVSALVAAVSADDAAAIQRLAATGIDIDLRDAHGLTPLVIAARSGRTMAIHALARAGARVNEPDPGMNNWTPLAHAIHRNQRGSIEALLDQGADPGLPYGEHRVTPLMMAAGYGYTDIVELLLARGADPRARTVGGFTALAAAVRGEADIDRFTLGRCQTATVRALVTAAPDLTLPNEGFGKSARWFAWFGRCSEVLALVDARSGQPARPTAAAPGR